jgi:hypothetical protein
MLPTKTIVVIMATVNRDDRDQTLDYQIPLSRARELFAEGILSWDVTNQRYCTHKPKDRPV